MASLGKDFLVIEENVTRRTSFKAFYIDLLHTFADDVKDIILIKTNCLLEYCGS